MKRHSRDGTWRLASQAVCYLIAACLAVGGAAAGAEEPNPAVKPDAGAISGDLGSLSDKELQNRIDFITGVLDDGKLHAQIWQYGFTAGYGTGIVLGSVLAADRDHKKKRVTDIVTAAKATLGTARMLFWPHPGRHGAEAIHAMDSGTREDQIRRLHEAEELLHQNDSRARTRWGLQRHLGNIGLNLVGGAFVWGLGRSGDVAESVGVGIAVGTIQTFSMPWRAEGDLADYRKRFGIGEVSRVSWNLAPMVTPDGGTGAMLQLQF